MPVLVVGGLALLISGVLVVLLVTELNETWREFLQNRPKSKRDNSDDQARPRNEFKPKKPVPLTPPPVERRSEDTIRRMIDFFEEDPE